MGNHDPRRTPIYDRLKVKANPPTKPPAPTPQQARPVPPAPKPQPSDTGDPYLADATLGALKLDLHLLGGEVLAGVMITNISRYAIEVVDGAGRKICVLKHALLCIAPAVLDEGHQ